MTELKSIVGIRSQVASESRSPLTARKTAVVGAARRPDRPTPGPEATKEEAGQLVRIPWSFGRGSRLA